MSIINILLGRYDRKNYNPADISKSALTWEGNRKEVHLRTNNHNNPNNFSNHTERDEVHTVGKLYKGYIEEDEISQEQSGPVKKLTPPKR